VRSIDDSLRFSSLLGCSIGALLSVATLDARADPPNADCCSVRDAPSCGDAECAWAVCLVDPWCCQASWDARCASLAQDGCDGCGGHAVLITAFAAGAVLPGLGTVTTSDLVAFDARSGTWTMILRGAEVGLSGAISGATILPDGDLIIATVQGGVMPGLLDGPSGEYFTRNDLLRFTPDSPGDYSAGSWHFFFDGSDVALSSSNLAINGISTLPEGDLVVATTSGGQLPGDLTCTGHDVLRFSPSSLGSNTAGTWSIYMRGSSIGLVGTGHRLDGVFVRADGSLLLSTAGSSGFGGFVARGDVVCCTPSSGGPSAGGSLSYYLRTFQMGLPSTINLRSPFLTSHPVAAQDRSQHQLPAACGQTGDCCRQHDGVGCARVQCCELICASDPFCCEQRWDEYCAVSAEALCSACERSASIVVSFGVATTLPNGLTVEPWDLARYEPSTGIWDIYFRGGQVGLNGLAIAACEALPDGDLLFSFAAAGSIPGLVGGPSSTSFTSNDVLRFRPMSTGPVTAGTWSFYFDGSDVGLSSSGFAIRAIAVFPDGRLVFGTNTGGSIPGVGPVSGNDLLEFAPVSLGEITSGSLSLLLRGATIGLESSGERLDFASISEGSVVTLSTRSSFAMGQGISGTRGDLISGHLGLAGSQSLVGLGLSLHGVESGLVYGTDLRDGFLQDHRVEVLERPISEQPGEGPSTGWTSLPQFLSATGDSRIVYVSSDGDDAAATSFAGRGYYVPGDAAVGSDPTRPAGTVVAYRTLATAQARLRDNKADWLLFRRGDAFVIPDAGLTTRKGESPEARSVIGAYGVESHPRPILIASSGIPKISCVTGDPTKRNFNVVFASLDLPNGFVRLYQAHHVLLEDCRYSTSEIISSSGNVQMRRCTIADGFQTGLDHLQGLFLSSTDGVLIEECVFDRNGYKEDPNLPATWTGPVRCPNSATSTALLPVGQGFQPRRNWFCRNLYLSSYRNLRAQGNIFARGASGNQFRVGGVIERNVWIWNDDAISPITQTGREYLHGMTVARNLVLHDDHMIGEALWGGGMIVRAGTGDRAILEDNVLAHFHRGGTRVLGGWGIEAYGTSPAERADKITIRGNDVCMKLQANKRGIMVRGTSGTWGTNGALSLDLGGNDVAFFGSGSVIATTETDMPMTFQLGTNGSGGNRYLLESVHRFATAMPEDVKRTYSDWKSRGWDAASQTYSTIESLASAAGWSTAVDAQGRRGWERDIVSYMQSIDPTYVVDEELTTDAGVPASSRRAGAKKVWRVLAGLEGGLNGVAAMSEADARLAARRQHAFLAFIERARANRKGAWDQRYTADALNNYIRQGFGKPLVEGPYTALLPEQMP